MTTLTVRIPDELKDELEHICEEQHRSTSEVIRESLRRFVVAEELQSIRKMARPFAKAAGFLTDEDVFEEIS